MARLQDFQQVTPTDSDNLLVVQATGQGLATVGSTLGAKMDKANPSGTGTLSMNASIATGEHSVALGLGCTASGDRSFAVGYNNEASGVTACAVNSTNTASGSGAFCSGYGNIAQRQFNHVFGMYNQADTGGTGTTTKGNYIEIVGKGANPNSRSNARTLDWSGNEVLAGGLKINGNKSVASIDSFTQDITTTADGLAGVTIPTGVAINNIFAIIVQNPSGVYLYGFLIKQPSVLWANIRNYNGTAYASQSCTIRLFYYVT